MLYNVTLKSEAPKEELDKAKEEAKTKGGVIKHEYTLIKGFVTCWSSANGALF
ncbi:hypothetical protein KEM52_004027 [Ascosphaera acerosa]|nr:hypothetical protein KEM52_004027 [Ascosphaera acerosa]